MRRPLSFTRHLASCVPTRQAINANTKIAARPVPDEPSRGVRRLGAPGRAAIRFDSQGDCDRHFQHSDGDVWTLDETDQNGGITNPDSGDTSNAIACVPPNGQSI